MSFEHFCSRKNTFSVGVTDFGEFCLPFLFLCPASTEDNHNRLLPKFYLSGQKKVFCYL